MRTRWCATHSTRRRRKSRSAAGKFAMCTRTPCTTRGVHGRRARCRRGAMPRAARCACAWSCRSMLVRSSCTRSNGRWSKKKSRTACAEASPSGFQSQQADALVAIAKTYLGGGATEWASDSASTADHCQLVIHVDEAALHGGAGRADAPLETVKRLACDASLVVVTEDERGTPLNVGRKHRTVSTPLRRALWARDRHCRFPGCHRTRFVDAHHVRSLGRGRGNERR